MTRRWRMLALGCLLALLGGCNYVEHTREVGHKGKARMNPYLAAERFLEEWDVESASSAGWPRLQEDDLMMLLVPASVLTAEGYLNSLDRWILDGGHAVILLEHGEHYLNDWASFDTSGWIGDEERSAAFREWAAGHGVDLKPGLEADGGATAEEVKLAGRKYEVFMEADVLPARRGSDPEMVVSRTLGYGRVTFVADARVFRNRYIGDYDHAALLLALTEQCKYGGAVRFVRSAGMSFWGMLWDKGWPALVALILLVVLWLWKSLPRFGPLDSLLADQELRAYDHHLGALGGFHWRLDRAEGLLKPLRIQVLERAQRLALTSGHRDDDIFTLMAERAGMDRERVERAMTFERARDPGSFTRLVADLQTIHLSIP